MVYQQDIINKSFNIRNVFFIFYKFNNNNNIIIVVVMLKVEKEVAIFHYK